MGREIQFYKYQGTGNDFIIIDQWDEIYELNVEEIAFLCDRRMGIGADGLMFLRRDDDADFKMVYYNSDGNESTMCGNGGRCISALYFKKMGKHSANFLAIDGYHESKLMDEGIISLHMSDVRRMEEKDKGYFLDTGSPHLVIIDHSVDHKNIAQEGAKIRYSDQYKLEGVNVNFMQLCEGFIKVRTYERGVEDETLSCGTGVTASAIVAGRLSEDFSGDEGVGIQTLGGNLNVRFDSTDEGFQNIWLTGPAVQVYKGEISIPSH